MLNRGNLQGDVYNHQFMSRRLYIDANIHPDTYIIPDDGHLVHDF